MKEGDAMETTEGTFRVVSRTTVFLTIGRVYFAWNHTARFFKLRIWWI